MGLRFNLSLLLLILILWPCYGGAQIFTSTISGIVMDDSNRRLPDTRVDWLGQGREISVTSDAEGRFFFHFVKPGLQRFRFKHPSIPDTGEFQFMVDPNHQLNLQVLMVETPGKTSGSDRWEIRKQSKTFVNPTQIERVYTSEWMESVPSARHLWALLNHTSATIVADRFDIGGMHSDRQMLLGARGSSWSQNQAGLNGVSLTHPSGEGIMIYPDLSALETLTFAVGGSPTTHVGTGAHLLMTPKSGTRQLHGQAELFFQGGALQNTNPTERDRFFGISQSDERWRHFIDGSVQIGGPLGSSPWTYFGSFSQRNLEKKIRNHPLAVHSSGSSGSIRFVGQIAPRDQLEIYWSGNRFHRPQSGASPQVSREATLNETDNSHAFQGAWSRFFSPKSLLDLRFGLARSRTDSGYQIDAAGQSREDLFKGFALQGSMDPLDMVKLLDNGRSGRAPLIGDTRNRHWHLSFNLTTVRAGLLNSNHRVSLGGSFRNLSSIRRESSSDGVNLLFFEGAPDSVRLLNTPIQTQDRILQGEIYGADLISVGRLSVGFSAAATFSKGENLTRSSQDSNSIVWRNISGRVGIAYHLFDSMPLVIRGSMARIYHQPLTSTWTAVNPNGLGTRLYTWSDGNQDGQYQDGEETQILKVYGAPYSTLDPLLENPHILELNLGLDYGLRNIISVRANGYRRFEHDLMSLVNVGVPFSAYTPVEVLDPGDDGNLGAGGDDSYVTVFNQDRETLGQDRYMLTNPEGHKSFSEGFNIRLIISLGKFQAEAETTRYRAVSATAPGISARENDTGALLGVYDDPNKAIFANGSTYFDRGTLAHLWVSCELPWKTRVFLINSYQDGLPYSRYLPIKGLNQGTIGVLTRLRGAGPAGAKRGFRTLYNLTSDVRLSRTFTLGPGRITGILDVFNIINTAQSLVQTDDTSPTHLWRIPLSFETPRSLQLGIRYQW